MQCDSALHCTQLAEQFKDGIVVPTDYAMTAALYERGCKHFKDASSCNSLALAMEEGEGVTIHIKGAAKLYKKGCEGGTLAACTNLGNLYATGMGVERNYKRALWLQRMGCKRLGPPGCDRLGVLYAGGLMADDAMIHGRFDEECNKGNFRSCGQLAIFYYLGVVVEGNENQAKKLWQTACDGYNRIRQGEGVRERTLAAQGDGGACAHLVQSKTNNTR